jgi:hypothetical protein
MAARALSRPFAALAKQISRPTRVAAGLAAAHQDPAFRPGAATCQHVVAPSLRMAVSLRAFSFVGGLGSQGALRAERSGSASSLQVATYAKAKLNVSADTVPSVARPAAPLLPWTRAAWTFVWIILGAHHVLVLPHWHFFTWLSHHTCLHVKSGVRMGHNCISSYSPFPRPIVDHSEVGACRAEHTIASRFRRHLTPVWM